MSANTFLTCLEALYSLSHKVKIHGIGRQEVELLHYAWHLEISSFHRCEEMLKSLTSVGGFLAFQVPAQGTYPPGME